MPQRIEHPSRPQSPLTPHRTCILAFLVHNSSISLLANCIAVQTRKEYFTSRVELVGLAVTTLLASAIGPGYHMDICSSNRTVVNFDALNYCRVVKCFQIILPLRTSQKSRLL